MKKRLALQLAALTLLLLGLLSNRGVGAQEAPPFQLQVDYSPHGMVAAGQPLATWAGVQMLEMGGNAADAAVAAAFAIAVVEPSMNSIGGRTQILIRLPNGEIHGIDATTQAPITYDPETAPQAPYGYPVIGIPGAVAGLVRLQGEFGTLPLETVMGPAIRYAEGGFVLLPGEARRQSMSAAQVAEFEGTRQYYLKADGSPYEAGEVLIQRDLANTLNTISKREGESFYRGEIAQQIAADMQTHGAAVTLESLADYRAVDADIVRGSYRGYEIIGSNIPSAGALTIEALHILENFELGAMNAAERATLVAQALQLAFEDWGDARRSVEAAREIISKEWAAERAAQIRIGVAAEMETAFAHPEGSHTTHLSTADADGMMVSLTQTIGPGMGSRVATPGLGFLYAATLGGYLGYMEPGQRASSNISPFMVLKDGEPFLVLGAAGGAMIEPAIVNAIVHFIDEGLSFAEAVAAPRIAAGRGGVSMETHVGAGWHADVVEGVRALGLEIREVARTGAFGRIHGIHYNAVTGQWEGVADPDWEGTALGARRR